MNYFDGKWWYAQYFLGMKSVIHYLKKLLFWRQREGLEQFRANYVADGLPAFTPAHRAIAHEPGHCTSCGMCEAVCPLLAFNPNFLGPMRFILSGARGGPILPDIRDTLRVLTAPDCQSCQKCERACPEQISILQLAKEFTGQLIEVESFSKRE